MSASARAQVAQDCQSISDRNGRLDCYDRLFPPANRQIETSSRDSAQHNTVVSAPADPKTTLDYSWANFVGCKSISKAPAFKFTNIPANARSASLVLTQGEREFGGQEAILPASGLIPEGLITMRAPCLPGVYRWTATIKSATGVILATVHADRPFPAP
jgi:hypothetical protein